MLYCALSKVTTHAQRKDPIREDLVQAGIRLLADQGSGALVMRRVAAAAGVSTMCVYSRFGDKAGLINAVYDAGFAKLDEAMANANVGSDPRERLMSLALAYRGFAIANPALYSLMFERIAGFEPLIESRNDALGAGTALLIEAMTRAIDDGLVEADSPGPAAYLLWTAVNGAVGLELAQASHHPVPAWFMDVPAGGEAMLREVVETTLRGMAPAAPVVRGI